MKKIKAIKIIKVIKIILIFFLIVISILLLSGCEKKDDNQMKEKIKQEMNYLDDKLISMLNELNNITLGNFSIIYNKIELSEETANSAAGKSTGNKR